MEKIIWNIYGLSYNKLREFQFYQELINDVYEELNVSSEKIYLDAGCGTGSLIEKIANNNKAKIYGIDFSRLMLRKAIKNTKNLENVVLAYADLNKKLPFENEFFDGIACVHVLSHLEDPYSTLKEFYRILKNGGRIVVADLKKGFSYKAFLPFYKEYIYAQSFDAIKSLPSFFLAGMSNLLLDIRGKGKKIEFFTKNKIEDLFRKVNFRNIKSKYTYLQQSILVSGEK